MEKEEREPEPQISRLKLRAPVPAHLLSTGSFRFSSTQKFVPFVEDFQERRTFDPGGEFEMLKRAGALISSRRKRDPKVRTEQRFAEHPRAPRR